MSKRMSIFKQPNKERQMTPNSEAIIKELFLNYNADTLASRREIIEKSIRTIVWLELTEQKVPA